MCYAVKSRALIHTCCFCFVVFFLPAKKGSSGKSKEELTLEKRQELERRLQDVSGQLNSGKKPAKPKAEKPGGGAEPRAQPSRLSGSSSSSDSSSSSSSSSSSDTSDSDSG